MRSLGCLLGLLMVLLSGCVVPPQAMKDTTSRPLHLFLLAGQSNMAGRGEVTPDRREPIPGVFALREDGSWGPAVDPIHWDKTVAGVGLARSFALAYQAQHPGVDVGFVPAACGGSPVEVWVPGAYYEPTRSHPYDDALARVAAVRNRGELKGILWHQGEADSRPERVGLYEARLGELFARMRRDLGDADLPILVGQLGRFPERPWTEDKERVNAIHQRIAAGDPNIGYVSAEGLTAKDDLIHFDTAGLVELGRRYAEAWETLGRDG